MAMSFLVFAAGSHIYDNNIATQCKIHKIFSNFKNRGYSPKIIFIKKINEKLLAEQGQLRVQIITHSFTLF